MRLQGAPQKLGKTRQLKQPDIELASATLRPLSKEPTQPLPYVEQQDGQSHQQKTVGRIGRSRPASDLACTAVTGLNAEAAPIEAADLARRHVQMDKNEHLPARATFQSFGAFRRREDATHDQVGCPHLAGLAIVERMLGTVALTALAERPRTARLTSDWAGNQGWNLLLLQESLHLDACKAAVQQQTSPANVESINLVQQVGQGFYIAGFRQYKADTQGKAQVVDQDVGGGNAIEAGRAVLSAAPHPQSFCLRALSIIRSVMKVDGYFLGPAPETQWQIGHQRFVQHRLQLRQFLDAQLLIDVTADRLRVGRSHQVSTNRFNGPLVSGHASSTRIKPGVVHL
jgi:hypothetical protein